MHRPALIALTLLAACAQTESGAPLPPVTAAYAANVADTAEGHARDACRNAAQVQLLNVLSVSDVRPVSGSGGMRIGTDMILRVSQGGTMSDIRCSFTDSSRLTVLSEV